MKLHGYYNLAVQIGNGKDNLMKTKGLIVYTVLLILLSSCCGEIYVDDLDVDVNPLYELDVNTQDAESLSDLIDLERFPPLDPESPSNTEITYWGTWQRVDVHLYLAPDIQWAQSWFFDDCESTVERPSRITFGGDDNNQYCIPYVTEGRSEFELGCSPTGDYYSSVLYRTLTFDRTG